MTWPSSFNERPVKETKTILLQLTWVPDKKLYPESVYICTFASKVTKKTKTSNIGEDEMDNNGTNPTNWIAPEISQHIPQEGAKRGRFHFVSMNNFGQMDGCMY